MVRGVGSPLKAEAIRLRVEERRSLREIASLIGSPKGSLSAWLKPFPLTDDERQARSKLAKRYVTPKKSHGEESKHFRAVNWQNLTQQQKGRIAEAAVLFRLCLHDFKVYSSFADGDKADWMVETATGRVLKIQVRTVRVSKKGGLPYIALTCSQGHSKRRRYEAGEFDFVVGYYLFNDTAYVYSFDEIADNKTVVTISEQHAERWDKLLPAASPPTHDPA